MHWNYSVETKSFVKLKTSFWSFKISCICILIFHAQTMKDCWWAKTKRKWNWNYSLCPIGFLPLGGAFMISYYFSYNLFADFLFFFFFFLISSTPDDCYDVMIFLSCYALLHYIIMIIITISLTISVLLFSVFSAVTNVRYSPCRHF